MKKGKRSRWASAIAAAALLLSSASTAYAADPVFIVEGNYSSGDFTLSCDEVLFDRDSIVPGDEWSTQIELKNNGRKEMDISIREIINDSEDDRLFNQLQMEIRNGENVLYSGPYGMTDSPVTPVFTLQGGESAILDVEMTLPAETDNTFQGLSVNSTWVFEANYPESSGGGHSDSDDDDWTRPVDTRPGETPGGPSEPNEPVDTGAAYLMSNTVPMLYVVVTVTAAGLLFLVSQQKRRMNEKKEDKQG